MIKRRRPAVRIAIVAMAAALIALAAAIAERVAAARAVESVSRRARASSILLASSLRRELDKFRLLPIVLAEDRDAREALVTHDPAALAALSRKLEALSVTTRAANVYLLDARGRTVAASNWRRSDSFLGDDYAFRTYYREAARRGAAQQFALGIRSRRAGLYISRRLRDGARMLGVVVVKVEFDALEREWRDTVPAAFATDGRGIMLVTSDPSWRFQTISPMSETVRTQARRSLEYGAVPLMENPLFAAGAVARAGSAASTLAPFVEAIEEVDAGWQVHVLAPTGAAAASARTVARLLLAIALLASAALYLLWRYRRRVATARAEADAARRLASLNDRLVQANKLATLGQITAGVGHEISQPVAAIAAYAHNARALVERDRPDEAVEAIGRIEALTGRIGLITRELRGFARRASGESAVVPVADAVAGVALLLRHRLQALGADLVTDSTTTIAVRAERVRLEQVLVNLVQNALDAGANRVEVAARPAGDRVEILVADDGPGLSPEVREQLFQPFRTSKRDGLGLGLIICRDIVASLGGTLDAANPPTGATFVISLEHAT